MKAAILINNSASNNTGEKKWKRIKDKVLKRFPKNTIVIPYKVPFNLFHCLKKLINEKGVTCFISAGGDGSINYLLNALIKITGRHSRNYCLGGIGLGSSNDFLKPFSDYIEGVPVKINPDFNNLTDVGKVTYTDEESEVKARYFIVNASLGITADANLLFNKGDLFIRYMKSRSVGLTILYTVIKTLITYKNKLITVNGGVESHKLRIANLSLTKSPYISGNFYYDRCPGKISGKLGFHCTGDMTKMEIIRTLYDLSKGRYTGLAKRSTSFVDELDISSADFLAMETDGEIQVGKRFSFTTIPKALCLAS
ncbi:MAG: hypothetical protein JSV22_14370 [Bacteroidales bacterium]|nr:MAG: hypothetical protein JSV22_14370 [Bacteroidales bacterium]